MKRSCIRSRFNGRSGALRETLALAERVAPHDSSVLILGETGTGKDRLAETLHLCGARSAGPFVRIDCAAIPPELLESELFGHEKGAFTDARERRIGRIEAADGGTLYLDEITALDGVAQAKLLRVLEHRRVTRLGGASETPVDIRIIASSVADGSELADALRADLLYRLDVFRIRMPPLRDRGEDVAILVRDFLRAAKVKGEVSADALEILRRYEWPGNVRQLRNVIEQAAILAEDGRIEPTHLPASLASAERLLETAAESGWTLEQLEAEYIRRILDRTRGNASKAAALLGIHRKTLLEKRRRYRIGEVE